MKVHQLKPISTLIGSSSNQMEEVVSSIFHKEANLRNQFIFIGSNWRANVKISSFWPINKTEDLYIKVIRFKNHFTESTRSSCSSYSQTILFPLYHHLLNQCQSILLSCNSSGSTKERSWGSKILFSSHIIWKKTIEGPPET